MSQVNDQARQQALTRVAASRVRAVDATEAVRRGVTGCVRALPVSAGVLKASGVALAGLVAAGVVSSRIAARRKKKQALEREMSGRTVALQLLSAVAVPLLHRWLVNRSGIVAQTPAEQKTPVADAHESGLSGAFYRWLGLLK